MVWIHPLHKVGHECQFTLQYENEETLTWVKTTIYILEVRAGWKLPKSWRWGSMLEAKDFLLLLSFFRLFFIYLSSCGCSWSFCRGYKSWCGVSCSSLHLLWSHLNFFYSSIQTLQMYLSSTPLVSLLLFCVSCCRSCFCRFVIVDRFSISLPGREAGGIEPEVPPPLFPVELTCSNFWPTSQSKRYSSWPL